jgi:hypothetical protein
VEGNIHDFQVYTNQEDYDLVVLQIAQEIRLIKVTDIHINMQTIDERRYAQKKCRSHKTEVLA